MRQLRQKMINDMKIHRLSLKTQECYVSAVAGFAKFYNESPDRLSQEKIQAYLLHVLDERKVSWSTCNVILSGLKFFYTQTLGMDAMQLRLPPRKKQKHLPEILSPGELERLFASAATPKQRVFLMTTYAAGLRVSEAARLRLTDIDSSRMMIRVEQGKGCKDRYTILSSLLLKELRLYWSRHRPSPWLFPGKDRNRPMHIGTAQKIYYRAKDRAGITRGRGIHTLRHCFATHLLEAGVDLPTIQSLMGHGSIMTTMIYVRVTKKKLGSTPSPLDLLKVPEDRKPLEK